MFFTPVKLHGIDKVDYSTVVQSVQGESNAKGGRMDTCMCHTAWNTASRLRPKRRTCNQLQQPPLNFERGLGWSLVSKLSSKDFSCNALSEKGMKLAWVVKGLMG